MKRFSERYICVSHHPIIIVGECPGKQRLGQQNCEVFHGNRTGDFIEDVVRGKRNIILTNVCNYTCKEYEELGTDQLLDLICKFLPIKIITLGNVAKEIIESDYVLETLQRVKSIRQVISLPHPSYILRFNKNIEQYKQKLINELTQRVPAN